MEPTNKPSLIRKDAGRTGLAIEFLPDADEIERGPLPRGVRWTLHALLGAFVSFILWASLSHVDTVVTAKGRLINQTPNVIVQPLDTSIIKTIDVRVGQTVHKGDLLASLDPTFAGADEAQLRARYKSIDTQAKALSAEINGHAMGGTGKDADTTLQTRLAEERLGNLKAQQTRLAETIDKLKASIVANQKDQKALETRLGSLREIEAMQDRLLKENFGARLHYLEAQERRIEGERELQQVQSREIELRKDLAAAEAEKSALDKGWRQKAMEDLLGATRERDSLNEQLAKADKRNQMVHIVSPVDGVVLEIAKLAPGSIVREAETFFVIVPLNAPMEAEVQIDTSEVGQIKVGDIVHLKIDAFPYQKHGALDAKVRTISQDAFKKEGSGGQEANYYLARIAYQGLPKKMGKDGRLLPGMTLSAEIVVGKRTVMSYLLWPLTKALDESIREP